MAKSFPLKGHLGHGRLFPGRSGKGQIVLIAAASLMLTACASGGLGGLSLPKRASNPTNPDGTTPSITQTATDVAKAGAIVDPTTQKILANSKKLNAYCPTVSVLGDTNIFQTYERGGEGQPQQLQHQATITQTARECTTLGAEMFIKVGVAGRVLAGPKGQNSKAVLPLRIVVRQNDDVLYTKLHKVSVKLTPPDRSALFAKVDEAIAIGTPQERNVRILVGFDESAKK